MKREWFLLAAAVCFCLIGSAADLEISARGVQGGSAIVVRVDATESERYAAGEFRDWTERLTGEGQRIQTKEDVQSLRQKFGASQSAFAKFMGVSVNAFQNWEQGR